MKFQVLPNQLKDVAIAAEITLRARLQLPLASIKIEEPFEKSISWAPTFHWKLATGIIACEVSVDPLPVVLIQNFSDLISSGIPIKVISAFTLTEEMSSKKYQAIITKAKQLGIGLLPVDIDNDYSAKLEYQGISLTLMLPKIDMSKYKNFFHKPINDCYDLYMNGDPKHGVQELGQIIEKILNVIGQKTNEQNVTKLVAFSTSTKASKHYALNLLIQNMLDENILDRVFLKKCATFADMRNATSHRPKTIIDTKRLENNFKTSFEIGLQILEELPLENKKAGFPNTTLK